MKSVERGVGGLYKAIIALCGTVIVLMALMITYSVVMRFMGQPIGFSEQLNGYGLVIVCLLGLAPTLHSREHITVDIVTTRLSPSVRKKLLLATDLICAVVVAIFARYSWEWLLQNYRDNVVSIQHFPVPLYIPQLVIPIGMSLLALEYILVIYQDVRALFQQGTTQQGK